MAENHTNIYINHSNNDTRAMLSSIFQTLNDDPRPDQDKILATFIASSEKVSPSSGGSLAEKLIRAVEESFGEPSQELRAESKQEIAGYCSYHFVHGETADKIVAAIVEFVGCIAPDADVRAWLVGDDDPWELLFRFESGRVIVKEYEPVYEERNKEVLPSEYVWWHKGMPAEITEGFINEWKSVNDDAWEKEYMHREDAPLPTNSGPRCPYCGGELRTSRAKQCPSCFKSWHNEITIPMDDDVISYFKGLTEKTGVPFEKLINSYLKDCARKERKPNLVWTDEE